METTYLSHKNPFSIFPILLIGIFSIGLFLYFTSISSQSISLYSYEGLGQAEIRIIEILSGHAWQNHGTQVNSAFDCLGKNGSTRAFKTFGFTDSKSGKLIPTNLWMCQDVDGWYAVVTTVFEKVGNDKVARLVTAYKISSEIFPTIDDYIQHIVSKWGAVAISYSISAGQIFIQPKWKGNLLWEIIVVLE